MRHPSEPLDGFTPRTDCRVSLSSSSPDVVDAYGGMSGRQAGRFAQQFAQPLAYGFGLGSGRKADRFNNRLDAGFYGDSPLASFINTTQDVLPAFQSQSAALGQDIASRAPQLFGQYQQQIQQYLKTLQGYQGAGNEALAQSQQVTAEAMSPIQQQALYQEALRR